MNEAGRKSSLVKKIQLIYPKLVVFRHEDHFTAGVPDLSITDSFSRPVLTLWLEIKYYPSMKLRRIQQETLRKLGGYFVIYDCDSEPLTIITDAEGRLVEHGRLHEPVLSLLKRELDQEHHAVKLSGKELCPRCNRWARLETDHVIPRSLGGDLDRNNQQRLCTFCHVDKTARDGSTLQIHLSRIKNKLKVSE